MLHLICKISYLRDLKTGPQRVVTLSDDVPAIQARFERSNIETHVVKAFRAKSVRLMSGLLVGEKAAIPNDVSRHSAFSLAPPCQPQNPRFGRIGTPEAAYSNRKTDKLSKAFGVGKPMAKDLVD